MSVLPVKRYESPGISAISCRSPNRSDNGAFLAVIVPLNTVAQFICERDFPNEASISTWRLGYLGVRGRFDHAEFRRRC